MSYKYDYKGRRVARTTGTTTITYLYDGDQIIADYTGTGTGWQRRYYYGPTIDQPICMVRTPGAAPFVYYYHYDGLGSVAAMSAFNGALIEQYTYDVYGRPTIKSSTGAIRTTSAYNNPYMFTGREYDPNVGIYYYRARYYHPAIGRFLQTDPVKYSDGMNMYSYAHNNVINAKDPMGLDNPGCDLPGGDWGNHCWRRCCAIHDECYHIYGCTANSWGKPGKSECGDPDYGPHCKKCNDDVVNCFLTHIICDWSDTKYDYYGPCSGSSDGKGGYKKYGYSSTKNVDNTVNCGQ